MAMKAGPATNGPICFGPTSIVRPLYSSPPPTMPQTSTTT